MQPHIVFTNGRSGSNFLVNVINQHPNLLNYGEVLGEWTLFKKLHNKKIFGSSDNTAYLDFILSSKWLFYLAQFYAVFARLRRREPLNFKRYKNIKALGFKEFQVNFSRAGLENYLKDRTDIKVIYLYREDIFRRYLSKEALSQTNVAVSRGDSDASSNKVVLDTNSLLEEIEVIDNENKLLAQMVEELTPDRVYTVRYEDLFSEVSTRDQICKEIFEFLNVPNISVQGKHRKILSNKISDTIENLDEVKSCLEGTPYLQLLEE